MPGDTAESGGDRRLESQGRVPDGSRLRGQVALGCPRAPLGVQQRYSDTTSGERLVPKGWKEKFLKNCTSICKTIE